MRPNGGTLHSKECPQREHSGQLEVTHALTNIKRSYRMQADERAEKCRFLSMVTLTFDL